MKRAALALLLAGAATAARAESERAGFFDLRLSGYRPNIDAEFTDAAGPWGTIFGNDRAWMVRGTFGKTLWNKVGSVDLIIGGGYFEKYGKGLVAASGEPSSDKTAFKVVPVSLGLSYRFDWLALNYKIPLSPYLRANFERYNWWTLNGAGDTPSFEGHSGSGATNGYSFTGGIAFLLDIFDEGMAREMDQDTGVNDSYLFIDFTKSYINDFGSKKSWDLSDDRVTVTGGLLFVF
jgi:hypothetical protein